MGSWKALRGAASIASTWVVMTSASAAFAGNASYIGVAAASEDGKVFAVFQDADGAIGSCGLSRVAPKPSYEPPGPLIATAACVDGERNLVPATRWKWSRRAPEVAMLRPFHTNQVSGAPARISMDRDTRVQRVEIEKNGEWFPILADDSGGVTEVPLELRYGSPETTETSTWMRLTGFVRLDHGYLLRLYRSEGLTDWDQVISISDDEARNVQGRQALARQKAAAATKALRAQRQNGSGVFIATPAGPVNQVVRKRNRAAAARSAVRLWEVVAAYGALTEPDVRDALWLIAWIDAPTRRLEALRWYLGFRDRNPKAAAALVLELESDPETAFLAVHLRSAPDPLRNLPDVAGTLLTDENLKGVSDEGLRWLHLAQWAAQGGYRFEDPVVREYFAQFPWYCPIPKDDWPRWRSKKFLQNPDARLLRAERAAYPSGASKESLEAILRAERARGVSPPKL